MPHRLCKEYGYIKAIAAFTRLESQADIDGSDRITEGQWAEMAQQFPIIEQILADTKELLQSYFDAVDASMVGFYS